MALVPLSMQLNARMQELSGKHLAAAEPQQEAAEGSDRGCFGTAAGRCADMCDAAPVTVPSTAAPEDPAAPHAATIDSTAPKRTVAQMAAQSTELPMPAVDASGKQDVTVHQYGVHDEVVTRGRSTSTSKQLGRCNRHRRRSHSSSRESSLSRSRARSQSQEHLQRSNAKPKEALPAPLCQPLEPRSWAARQQDIGQCSNQCAREHAMNGSETKTQLAATQSADEPGHQQVGLFEAEAAAVAQKLMELVKVGPRERGERVHALARQVFLLTHLRTGSRTGCVCWQQSCWPNRVQQMCCRDATLHQCTRSEDGLHLRCRLHGHSY